MKRITIFTALLCAGPAMAHTGHIADVGGHDHWVAGIALGIAVGLGLWAALKDKARPGKDAEAETGEQAESDAEMQEA